MVQPKGRAHAPPGWHALMGVGQRAARGAPKDRRRKQPILRSARGPRLAGAATTPGARWKRAGRGYVRSPAYSGSPGGPRDPLVVELAVAENPEAADSGDAGRLAEAEGRAGGAQRGRSCFGCLGSGRMRRQKQLGRGPGERFASAERHPRGVAIDELVAAAGSGSTPSLGGRKGVQGTSSSESPGFSCASRTGRVKGERGRFWRLDLTRRLLPRRSLLGRSRREDPQAVAGEPPGRGGDPRLRQVAGWRRCSDGRAGDCPPGRAGAGN